MGGISYAWYLVHWPVLVLWLATSGKPRAGALDGAVVIAVSLTLAWVVSRAVERPVRSLPWVQVAPWRSAALVLGTAGVVVAASGLAVAGLDARAQRGAELAAGAIVQGYPGARSLTGGAVAAPVPTQDRLPAATSLRTEFASLPALCNGPWADAGLGTACTQLEPRAAPTATVAVVGDSHAEQWLAALQPLAEENRWRLVALLKGACSFGDPASRRGDCATFNSRAMHYLETHPVDLLVTVSTAAHRSTPAERVIVGYETAVRAVTARGTRVVGLRDNPRFPGSVVSCALEHGDQACTSPAAVKLAATNPADALAGIRGFTSLDLTDLVCPDGQCPPAVGNVWVYVDDNHLTRSYSATLTPALAHRLRAAGAWPGSTTVVAGRGTQVRR